MGSFFAYTLYSGVFLLLLYLIYKVFLSKEKQITLNRAVLLGCYAMSFLAWPLAHIEWHSASVEIPESSVELDFSVIAVNPAIVVSEKPSFLPQVILWIYLVGASAVLLNTLCSMARLVLYIRKGKRILKDGHTLIVMADADTAPFSFGHYVVMSEADYVTVRDAVTAHEFAHIRCRHYIDLILAQAVCVLLWYNPAAWLMRDELKLLHEYQADSEVIDGGVNQNEYQMLLIRKTIGNRFHTLANNLNHSKLKQRIAMMQKEKSRGRRYLRLFSLALAVDLAVAVVNIPAVASGLERLEGATLEVKKEVNTPDTDQFMRATELSGETSKLMEYLALNVRYPENAQTESPIYVDGVRADDRLDSLEYESIEGMDEQRSSELYTEGRTDTTHKKTETLYLKNDSNVKLAFQPDSGVDGAPVRVDGAPVRVDGKMLKESMDINVNDIESLRNIDPDNEFPQGLLDIKLKKSTSKKRTAVSSKRAARSRYAAQRKQALKRETIRKRKVAIQKRAAKKKEIAKKNREIKRFQARKRREQARKKQQTKKKQEAEKRRQTKMKEEVVIV